MLYGWTGKLLRVDLSRREVRSELLNEEWARQYVGGRGIGVKYLYEEMDPKVDPFDPANKLIFASGPLTGTMASCGARYMVVTKGPLTGAITTSNSGGRWAPELKYAGYDMIIVEGRAERPLYLWVFNERVALRDAGELWGKGVFETEDSIRRELGVADCSIAAIGPAGENRVRFAAIMNDKFRAAGRSGVGAVMGAKGLKAIAVRGTGAVRVARPQAMMRAQWAMRQKLAAAPSTGGMARYGTLGLMNVINEHGALPTNNFQLAQFEEAEAISGETLAQTRLLANKACFACTIACGRVSRVAEQGIDRYVVTTSPRNWRHASEGPEYENAWALGADCGVGDLDAVFKANVLCNDLGMDPISMGATLAAAMELYEKGVIDEAQTGMALRFGSGEALVSMVEKTALRRGFGNELAEGAKRMTEKFGHGEFFMGVKGQEFPAYDPRAIQGMGLGYATSNRGACHLRAYTVSPEILGQPIKMDPRQTEGKAEITKIFQDHSTALDATGLCVFLTFGVTLEDIHPVLVATTGVDYTLEDFVRAGERIWNLERLWNLRAGLTGDDDTLPRRILQEPIPAGPARGEINRLGEMLGEYYRLRGWSPKGEPSKDKLAELGLSSAML